MKKLIILLVCFFCVAVSHSQVEILTTENGAWYMTSVGNPYIPGSDTYDTTAYTDWTSDTLGRFYTTNVTSFEEGELQFNMIYDTDSAAIGELEPNLSSVDSTHEYFLSNDSLYIYYDWITDTVKATQSLAGDTIRPVDLHGALSISNKKVVSENGDTIVLRGVGFPEHNWWHKWENVKTLQWTRDDFGANCVRMCMWIDDEVSDPGYMGDSITAVAKVYEVIDAAIELGMYVIVNWHGADMSEKGSMINFLTDLAEDYGSYDNLIYEPYNEFDNSEAFWGGSGGIKEFAHELVDSIRAIDSDNLIFLGTKSWCQDLDTTANDPILGETNIAYTGHFYAQTHGSGYRTRWDNANEDIAIVVTECASCNASAGHPHNWSEWDSWTSWMRESDIGSFTWAFGSKEPYATFAATMFKPSSEVHPTIVLSSSDTSGFTHADILRFWVLNTWALNNTLSVPSKV